MLFLLAEIVEVGFLRDTKTEKAPVDVPANLCGKMKQQDPPIDTAGMKWQLVYPVPQLLHPAPFLRVRM